MDLFVDRQKDDARKCMFLGFILAVVCQPYGVVWSMALQDMNVDHVTQLLRQLEYEAGAVVHGRCGQVFCVRLTASPKGNDRS